MIGVVLLSMLVAFSGAIVPGPLFVATLNQALLVGWSAGLWLSVGHLLAELALVIAIAAGLGGVLRKPSVSRLVGIIGGLVLLYFAWGMLTSGYLTQLPEARHVRGAAMSIGMLIGQGALLSVTNPYWHLWWATAGIGLIAQQTGQYGPRAWSAFFIGHELGDFLWYVAVSTLVALGGNLLNPAVHRGLILTCGLGIAVLGVLFLWRAVTNPDYLSRVRDRDTACRVATISR